MRNLSPLGTIHSPIDADRDVKAYLVDFNALGLPDQSPFAILRRPRAQAPAPAEPKPKKPRQTIQQKVLASLREPGETNFNVPIMSRAESDRTLAIQGRGLS